MGFIDADAHVDENEETWEYMDASDSHYKPVLLQPPGWGYLVKDSRPHPLWLIAGNVRLKRYRDDELTGTTEPMRELIDVDARIKHMDELGIDVQVLYPTMFLHAVTTQPEVEWAIHFAYNRWLADKTDRTNGRLRWAYLPSVLNIEKSVADLAWAKDHGACAVMKKGVEYNRSADDPYFLPLYAEAERLDLPICFHQGSGTLQSNAGDAASMQRLSVLAAFSALTEGKVSEAFPRLRFGFIEAGASWIPYVIKELGMRGKSARAPYDFKSDLLRHHHFFVTCDTEDDVPLLIDRYGGEDYLMIGTDYSHQDSSAELRAHQAVVKMGEDGEISRSAAARIAESNARVLYGL
jgi:predicted TIM-barrel fold metal-dependent hydrolase